MVPKASRRRLQLCFWAILCAWNTLFSSSCSVRPVFITRKKLKNPNGLILGTPGSGKSFSAKREITNAFLVTDDDIIICDPEAEYAALVHKFEGQVIKISSSSTNYINPMDININYSEDDFDVLCLATTGLLTCLMLGYLDGLGIGTIGSWHLFSKAIPILNKK